ncbi:MAG TPA: MBL fold metallo-hydrolase [Anaerolineaceae bacterium]|nr:MBL fold metallo-hydrolase [Anaerolineaceae bacterium]HPN51292.1 MBL fold metallo-hydrolase [Anaerolineaceae bacterium]
MHIQFLGAARTVTGSCYLIHVNNQSLLLECGLYQGKREESYEKNRNFNFFEPAKIDAVILSHAHIDHSGNLPNLVKQGYNGPIYGTNGTVALVDIMLMDSGHIQECDVQFVNKKRAKHGLPPVEPIYTQEDSAAVKPHLVGKDYEEPFHPINGVTARLIEAGHILGSAAVRLDIEENGKHTSLWFSGDIGRPNMPLLRDPVLPEDVDYLMMECTYGDKPHRDPEEAFTEFRDVVARTYKKGGKVIIPAFAVGRTQELVYFLHQMNRRRLIPSIPVYVDSPLAVAASDVFLKFTDYFDEETSRFVANGSHPALNFEKLTYIRSLDESKALNERHEPMIIISASGMAESGRILHHLRNNIEDPRNTILIVSWQSPDTLGRRLADRVREVKIFGEVFQRKADIATIGGLSAHAGQDMLLRYALNVKKTARRIILVHGEPPAAEAFRQKLREEGGTPTFYPNLGEAVEIVPV